MSSHLTDFEDSGELLELFQQIVANWETAEATPSTLRVLDTHPELRAQKSFVIKLAYEEFRIRRRRGESLSPVNFCQQFASCQLALRRMLSVHMAVMEQHPSWMDEFSKEFEELDDVWPQPDEDFVGYRIVKEIGRGGLARVYLARQSTVGDRPVVLKVSARDTGEAAIMGRLPHSGIMPILHVACDADSGMHVVVMPFLGKTTLFDFLGEAFPNRQGPIPADDRLMKRMAAAGHAGFDVHPGPSRSIFGAQFNPVGAYLPTVLALMEQVAESLAFTHGRKILHRDLKPSNILLSPNGAPVLMDFNLSARTDGPGLLAGGTIPYMPVELLSALNGENSYRLSLGRAAFDSTFKTISQEDCATNDLRRDSTNRSVGGWVTSADPRSDIFACGVILYEMLTGQLPWGEPDSRQPIHWQAEWLLKRQYARPLQRHAVNAHIPECVFQLLRRCLATTPELRPSSAEELRAALRNCQVELASPAVQCEDRPAAERGGVGELVGGSEMSGREVESAESTATRVADRNVASTQVVLSARAKRQPMNMLRAATICVSVTSTLLAIMTVDQVSRQSAVARVQPSSTARSTADGLAADLAASSGLSSGSSNRPEDERSSGPDGSDGLGRLDGSPGRRGGFSDRLPWISTSTTPPAEFGSGADSPALPVDSRGFGGPGGVDFPSGIDGGDPVDGGLGAPNSGAERPAADDPAAPNGRTTRKQSEAERLSAKALAEIADARWSEALVTLQKAGKAGAPRGENLALQAYCLIHDRLFMSAASKCRDALASDFRSPAVLNNYGYALIKTKRYSLARQMLEEAVRLAPNQPEIHYNLAQAALGDDRVEQAVEQIELALELSPDPSCELRWTAARIFARAGEKAAPDATAVETVKGWEKRAAEQLETAVSRGLDPQLLDAAEESLRPIALAVKAKNVRCVNPQANFDATERVIYPLAISIATELPAADLR